MTRSTRFTASLLLPTLLVIGSLPLAAQPERRIVPRHDWAIELPELGRMSGLPGDCLFGDQIYPIGDVNGDSLRDWIATRLHCSENRSAISYDLLLYYGRRDSLPEADHRLRIGLEEGVDVYFRGAGDWDGDGHLDIATKVTPREKDSVSNPRGYGISRLLVWWGNETGEYSLNDTSELFIDADSWLGPTTGIARDWDHDGIDDLLTVGVAGLIDGEIDRSMPSTVLWRGSRERWGKERPALWSWGWNSWPSNDHYQFIDQDVDGYEDIVFYTNGGGGGRHGSVSIIYGSPEHVLDTANIHTITLDNSWGKYALFADITGDRVPELLVNTGGQEAIKAYVGFPGQRIEQQYGLGNEPGRPGEPVWWGKPWATIPLPGQLHDGWAAAGWSPIYDLGDVGLDGVCDVCVYSTPDIICYNGGQRFDSIYDSWIRRPASSFRFLTRLGDISGSGNDVIAFVSSNLVVYYQPSNEVPGTGTYRYMPPGVDRPASGLEDQEEHEEVSAGLDLQVFPNPSSGIVQLSWKSSTGIATIHVTDQLGQTVTRFDCSAAEGRSEWDASQTFGGVYFVTIEVDGVRESIEVRIQQ